MLWRDVGGRQGEYGRARGEKRDVYLMENLIPKMNEIIVSSGIVIPLRLANQLLHAFWGTSHTTKVEALLTTKHTFTSYSKSYVHIHGFIQWPISMGKLVTQLYTLGRFQYHFFHAVHLMQSIKCNLKQSPDLLSFANPGSPLSPKSTLLHQPPEALLGPCKTVFLAQKLRSD